MSSTCGTFVPRLPTGALHYRWDFRPQIPSFVESKKILKLYYDTSLYSFTVIQPCTLISDFITIYLLRQSSRTAPEHKMHYTVGLH